MKNSRFKTKGRATSPPWGLNDGDGFEPSINSNTPKPSSPPWGRYLGKDQASNDLTSKARKPPPNKDNFSSGAPPWGSCEE